ncbi:MAG: hypothetical protein SO101_15195 [Lachnospiraceae bacterium]|nr:hypothetical protein [Lachnospiraceae bacterium]
MLQELMERYLNDLKIRGLNENSLEICRRSLYSLHDSLPEDGILTKKNLLSWKMNLFPSDDSWEIMNAEITAVNGFLTYIGQADLFLTPFMHPQTGKCRELTREEYLRLLHTARMYVNKRLYLIIKVLCCTAVTAQELHGLTIELLQGRSSRQPEEHPLQDNLSDSDPAEQYCFYIPDILREELLRYASEKGIVSGSLFVTGNGAPLDVSNIRKSLKTICPDADVKTEKLKLMSLNMLYHRTFTEFQQKYGPLAEPAYEEYLKQEELTVGWEAEKPYQKISYRCDSI